MTKRLYGFSLIELLVVLALLALTMMLGIPQFSRLIAAQQLSSTASDFAAAAMQARSEAIKFNRRVVLQPMSGTDWSQGWQIYHDISHNGSYDYGTDTLVITGAPIPASVTVNTSITNRAAFGFDPSGYAVTIIVGTTPNGCVAFQLTNTAYQEPDRHVIFSRSGRVRIDKPALGASSCATD